MATDPKDILNDLTQANIAAQTLTDTINKGAKSFGDWSNSLGQYTTNAVSAFKSLGGALTDVFSQIEKSPRTFADLNRELGKTINMTGELYSLLAKRDPFAGFGQSGGAAIASISEQYNAVEPVINKIIGSTKLLGIPSSVITKIQELGAAFFEQVDQAQRAENAMLSLASQSGDLGKMYENAGSGLKNLENITGAYITSLNQAAEANRVTTKEVLPFVNALGSIPGFMKEITDVTDDTNERMDALTLTMRAAKGAQVDSGTASSVLTTAYEKLASSTDGITSSTERGIRMLSLMSTTSNTLNLRFKDTESFLENVAETFKDMGDNTEASTRILGNYINALKQTGISTKESINITENMVKALGNMSIGTKALLSLRGGGPGGLQGAFRIDQLIREGRLDEVARMMERTLRQQFGGRIYTQAEAAASPQAAAQFYRQTQLLQSGAFGGLARDPQQAARLLEAMRAGTAGEELKNSTDAMHDTVQKGTTIEEKQSSTLVSIANKLDLTNALLRGERLRTAREMFGTGGEGADREARLGAVRREMQAGVAGARGARGMASEMTTREGYETFKQIALQSAMSGLTSDIKSFGLGIKDLVSKEEKLLSDGVKGVFTEIHNAMKEIKEKTKLEAGTAASEAHKIEVVISAGPGLQVDPVKSSLSATNAAGNSGGVITVTTK